MWLLEPICIAGRVLIFALFALKQIASLLGEQQISPFNALAGKNFVGRRLRRVGLLLARTLCNRFGTHRPQYLSW